MQMHTLPASCCNQPDLVDCGPGTLLKVMQIYQAKPIKSASHSITCLSHHNYLIHHFCMLLTASCLLLWTTHANAGIQQFFHKTCLCFRIGKFMRVGLGTSRPRGVCMLLRWKRLACRPGLGSSEGFWLWKKQTRKALRRKATTITRGSVATPRAEPSSSFGSWKAKRGLREVEWNAGSSSHSPSGKVCCMAINNPLSSHC